MRRQWLAEPLSVEVERALSKLEGGGDVVAIAIMPDVHLAHGVCIGTVTATRSRLLPEAVGGDIGCGMCALRFDVAAADLDEATRAAAVLVELTERVPILGRPRRRAPPLPSSLLDAPLGAESLTRLRDRQAASQLGTLGRGNHFVELQRDEEGALWAMVHSGSRAMGPAVRDHYTALAAIDEASGLSWLASTSEVGEAYLRDVAWARAYARANRAAILEQLAQALGSVLGARSSPQTHIDVDHNHVQRELVHGQLAWVHRKGAQSAALGRAGIIPGSMGTASYHVTGRGHEAALNSSSHGAGRCMSRSEARRRVGRRLFERDMRGVWYDHRRGARLREEAPSAYKEIDAVMRAQRELVRIERRLSPVLVYKGT